MNHITFHVLIKLRYRSDYMIKIQLKTTTTLYLISSTFSLMLMGIQK